MQLLTIFLSAPASPDLEVPWFVPVFILFICVVFFWGMSSDKIKEVLKEKRERDRERKRAEHNYYHNLWKQIQEKGNKPSSPGSPGEKPAT